MLRDSENSRDRYNFRGKNGDGDNERPRDGRSNLLRPKRADGDADSEGWSTVKPRKSFGAEGAERFNGRMGLDRHRDDRREDRRFKDREDRDAKDRPQRGFDTFTRDKDNDHDQDRDNRRAGLGRGGRGESWRGDNDAPPTPRERNSNGDKYGDRSRGWRDKERDDRGDRGNDRNERNDRNDRGERGDRRWGRDQRSEVEPEWLEGPADDKKGQAHTQEDFEKWRQSTRREDKSLESKISGEEGSRGDAGGSFFGLEKQKVETPLAIDTGPDKFFGLWAAPKDEAGADSGIGSKKEGAAKSKTGGKSSRFTSFFSPQEELPRRQTEPPPPVPPLPIDGFFGSLLQDKGNESNNTKSTPQDQAAFQLILQKLQAQHNGGSGSTPPANAQQQPKPPAPEKQQSNPLHASEPFQQYRPELQEERPGASSRNSQQTLQDLLSQRQVANSQPIVRPDQMLQELVGQRQNALSQSSVRPDQPQSRNNTEFLMNLMRAAPEPQRTEQVLLRMPPQRASDRQTQQHMLEREQEMHRELALRERGATHRQNRPQPPPGFFDDPSFQRGPPPQHERPAGNPSQPTQILQRPPPPGLEQIQPGWAQPPTQLPPPQQLRQHNIAPPPGLAGGPTRNIPMQQMFAPGFPGIGNFPHPDAMAAPQRMQPPPGFYNAPPPGFLPPNAFQGPDGMPPFGAPFDGRGLPPQGPFRRQ